MCCVWLARTSVKVTTSCANKDLKCIGSTSGGKSSKPPQHVTLGPQGVTGDRREILGCFWWERSCCGQRVIPHWVHSGHQGRIAHVCLFCCDQETPNQPGASWMPILFGFVSNLVSKNRLKITGPICPHAHRLHDNVGGWLWGCRMVWPWSPWILRGPTCLRQSLPAPGKHPGANGEICPATGERKLDEKKRCDFFFTGLGLSRWFYHVLRWFTIDP